MPLTYHVSINPSGKNNHFLVTWKNLEMDFEYSFLNRAEITDAEVEKLWQLKKHQLPIGQKLFHFLDGDASLFQQALKKAHELGEKLVVELNTCHETADWPFELLAFQEEFLLLHSLHLVRFVSDHGINKKVPPGNRPLKLLFMASSALDVKPELDFEKEEESIFSITDKLPIDMEVEDSGSLRGLHAQLVQEKFDVVHLSGHAGLDENEGPFFVMEDDSGYRYDVFPGTLYTNALIENIPRLVFLSGCYTGQDTSTPGVTSTKENRAALSFARRLVEQYHVPAVIGWGRSVSDDQSIIATQMLYYELSRGRSILEACQRARVELKETFPLDPEPAWPMLRLFSNGVPLTPLVREGQKTRPKPRKLKQIFLSRGHIKVLENGFVGRRRQIQASFRSLTESKYKTGLLLLGAKGLGKSCLAGKLCERHKDYIPITIQGKLQASTMKTALTDAFIISQDKKGEKLLAKKNDFTKTLAHLCTTSFKEKNYLLILDNFDQNLENRENGLPGPLKLEAVTILETLLHYLPFSEKMTQLIITSRYGFTLTKQNRDLVKENLDTIWLTSFIGPEQRKKLVDLNHIMAIPQRARQIKLLTASRGNPLLMEEMNCQISASEITDEDQFNKTIERIQQDFTRKSNLYQIFKQCPDDLLDFLQRVSIYRRPVLAEGIEVIAMDAGIENWWGLLEKAMGLGLVEFDYARANYQVSPLLRDELLKQLENKAWCHQVAFTYYKKLCLENETVDVVLAKETIFHATYREKEAEMTPQGHSADGWAFGRKIERGVYEIDRREDYFQVEDEQVRANANRVALICRDSDLLELNQDYLLLKVDLYGDHFNLGESEPFHDQPAMTGTFCTCFLVQPDIIVTAGHCPVLREELKNTRVVFGYFAMDADQTVLKVHRDDIYKGTEILHKSWKQGYQVPDWAVVKLDRQVKGRESIILSGEEVVSGQTVYAIGYGRGLPGKYSPGSIVKKINQNYFEVDLDVSSGNSGSPLFDSQSHQLIGIVTQGYNKDFIYNGRSWNSYVYKEDSGSGPLPRCTSIIELQEFLNSLATPGNQ